MIGILPQITQINIEKNKINRIRENLSNLW